MKTPSSPSACSTHIYCFNRKKISINREADLEEDELLLGAGGEHPVPTLDYVSHHISSEIRNIIINVRGLPTTPNWQERNLMNKNP